MKALIIACMLALSACGSNPIQKGNGFYLYMDLSSTCPQGVYSPHCYFQNQEVAHKVVSLFNAAGVRIFMLPSDVITKVGLSAYDVFLPEVARSGSSFMLQEIGEWGKFGIDCEGYKRVREPVLLELNAKYGKAFLGFSGDEPNYTNLYSNHHSMKDCLLTVPGMSQKVFFLNALPLVANPSQMDHNTPGFGYSLNDLGGCNNEPLSAAVLAPYEEYLTRVFSNLSPTISAFDLYPYTVVYDNCTIMREKLMQQNVASLLKTMGRSSIPAAYIQTFSITHSGVDFIRAPSGAEMAHQVKFYSDLGIREFALFVSHTALSDGAYKTYGLLDENNNPTELYNNLLAAREILR